MTLSLDVRLDGYDQPIGVLASDDRRNVAFAYRADYLERPDAVALSLSLPLAGEHFDDPLTRAYFDNLLQERDSARKEIVDRHGLHTDDIAGILFHLGKDCAGAVSVLPEGAPPAKVPGDYATDYEPYSGERLAAIVRAFHEREPLPDDVQDPSPLAGVQSKIAVTRLPDGRLAEPRVGSGAPTTHILKVPDFRHRRDAKHENEAMELSRDGGFPTAEVELVVIAEVETLLVTRFDRATDTQGRIVRRHQEDFCQALGLPSRLKYERNGQPGRRYDVAAIAGILDQTVDPLSERRRFVDLTLFDVLIGNVDGHAKNFSLFHGPAGRIETTPRYDVMPTMLDRNTTDEFAYRIGTATRMAEIGWPAIDAFLLELGFASAAGRRRVTAAAVTDIIEAIDGFIERIDEKGMKNFADLVATNTRTFCARLDIPVPILAAGRDTFVRTL
ncbi:MAG: HipA domain-containing protein [Devosia sp.]